MGQQKELTDLKEALEEANLEEANKEVKEIAVKVIESSNNNLKNISLQDS